MKTVVDQNDHNHLDALWTEALRQAQVIGARIKAQYPGCESAMNMAEAPNPPGVATTAPANGVASLLSSARTRDDLANIVALRDAPVTPAKTEASRPAAAPATPANPPLEGEEEQPGQETLPPTKTGEEATPPTGEEETPPGEEETPEEAESTEPKPVTIHTGDPEADAAIAALNPDGVKHLAEMAKLIASGGTSIGELKRGFKLMDTVNELKTENEGLKAKVASGQSGASVGNQGGLPPEVAKLKTVQEVQERLSVAKGNAKALGRFLEANPDGGLIGDKEYTKQEVLDLKHAWEDEAEVLPQRGQQIQHQAQFTQKRAEVSAGYRQLWPQFNDPEHVDMKVAAPLMKDPRFANELEGDYMALAMATGHRVLQAQAAQRKAGKPVSNTATAPAPVPAKVVKPVGKVAPGKLHMNGANGGSAGARATDASVKAMLPGKTGSQADLAKLIQATGR